MQLLVKLQKIQKGEKAGIELGDKILKVNNNSVSNYERIFKNNYR